MPRRCLTCIHAERPLIDQQMVQGILPKEISKRPGMPPIDSLKRHRQGGHHRTPGAMVAHAKSLVAGNLDLHEVEFEERQTWLQHLRHQRVELVGIQAELRAGGHLVQAGHIAHAILKNQELIARWLGELVSVNRTTVQHQHVLISDPAWPKLYAGLTRLCQRHPRIRTEVFALLREVEDAAAVAAGGQDARVIEGHVSAAA